MAISILIVLAISITWHEFGHYLMARLFGVIPTIFSVGFGPALLRWKRRSGTPGEKRTEFRLCALPFGGYCMIPSEPAKIPGFEGDGLFSKLLYYALWPFLLVMSLLVGRHAAANETDESALSDEAENQGEDSSLNDRSNWISERGPFAEFAVSASGPIFNFAAAILLYSLVHMIGGSIHLKGGGELASEGFFVSIWEGIRQVAATTALQVGALGSLLGQIFSGNGDTFVGMFEGLSKSSDQLSTMSKEVGGLGLLDVLVMIANLNILLAWTNFLPFPGLDGSHMLLSVVRCFVKHERYATAKGAIGLCGVVFIGGTAAYSMLRDARFFYHLLERLWS